MPIDPGGGARALLSADDVSLRVLATRLPFGDGVLCFIFSFLNSFCSSRGFQRWRPVFCFVLFFFFNPFCNRGSVVARFVVLFCVYKPS